MHLDNGTVHRHRFDLDSDDLLLLQDRKDPIQHTCLGPAIHPRIDRMPVTEVLGQPAPFAAVFGHIQDRVKHLKIGDAHVAALTRKATLDTTILGLCDVHSPNILQGGWAVSATPYRIRYTLATPKGGK